MDKRMRRGSAFHNINMNQIKAPASPRVSQATASSFSPIYIAMNTGKGNNLEGGGINSQFQGLDKDG